MREIKFRAKAKNYNPMIMPESGWVEGFYYEDLCDGEIKSFIKNSELVWEVEKGTIGQFTGLYSSDKMPIYEGDIIQSRENLDIRLIIVYDEKLASFCAILINRYTGTDSENKIPIAQGWIDTFPKRIIGNIYDNKELLEE